MYSVIGYVLKHVEEVDAFLRNPQHFAEAVRRENLEFRPYRGSGTASWLGGGRGERPYPGFTADETFNNDIVRGLGRRNPAIDVVRVQDAGLSAMDGSTILEWGAQNGRVLLTHVATMSQQAYDRVREGKPMPGVIEVGRHVPNRVAIEEIVFLAECSLEGEVR